MYKLYNYRISKQVQILLKETGNDHDHDDILIKGQSTTLGLSDLTDLSSEFDSDIGTNRPLFSTKNELEFEINIDFLKSIEI